MVFFIHSILGRYGVRNPSLIGGMSNAEPSGTGAAFEGNQNLRPGYAFITHLPTAEILTAKIGKPSYHCHGSAAVSYRRGAAKAATPMPQRGFPSLQGRCNIMVTTGNS